MTTMTGYGAGLGMLIAAAMAVIAMLAMVGFQRDAKPVRGVTEHEDLAYGPAVPGNLLDLYVPDVPGNAKLPLLIWHSGSAWFSNTAKDSGDAVAIAEEFTARGYAVATISIRSSFDARFPAEGYDVRGWIRSLRENAAEYGIDARPLRVHGQLFGRVGHGVRRHHR